MSEQQRTPDGSRQPAHDRLAEQWAARQEVRVVWTYLEAALRRMADADRAVAEVGS